MTQHHPPQRKHPGEARLPAAVAVAVAVGLYATLPEGLLVVPRVVVPVLEGGWASGFIDYFYVSVTNSSAFSPTDTMPLTPRAKMLMAVESVSALMLSVLVIARGISLIK
ncbi:hypothetical protein ACFUC1_17230 [Pedococcus sp. NPDC057267]|uniref:hypothetical protein n=1 Tax=Pedococcus sp. NPDC057267 TaxID=3346077 RepID=UPI00362F78FD